MKRWWISWHGVENGSFELHSPWWVSGFNFDNDLPVICAAVIAPDEEAAKELILSAYDERPENIKWRFVEERPDDWLPFSERFPKISWMQWPSIENENSWFNFDPWTDTEELKDS